MAELYRKARPDKPEKSLDDIVSRNVMERLRRDPPGGSHQPHGKPGKPGAGVDDTDLIASMAKRLSVLEKDLRERTSQLQKAQADNAALKSKLKMAEDEVVRHAATAAGSSGAQADDSPTVVHLKAENTRLRAQASIAWKQVAEMKSFLNDYGMVWVGDDEHGSIQPAPQPPEGRVLGGAPGNEPWYHAEGNAQRPPNHSPTLSPEPSYASAGAGPKHGDGSRPPSSGAPLPPRPPPSDKPDVHGAGGVRAGEIRRRSYTSGGGGSQGPRSTSQPGNVEPAAAPAKPVVPAARPVAAASGAKLAGVEPSTSAAAGVAGPGPVRRSVSHIEGTAAAVLQPLPQVPRAPSDLVPLPSSSLIPSHGAQPAGGGAGPSMSAGGSSGAGPSGVGASGTATLPFRMADLLARVEELNQLAGDGCGQLVPGKGVVGGHVLHTPDPVRLTIFRDGLQLHRAPARPFGDPSSVAVLRDVLDGYFPGPLRTEFPDGVPIKVVDRTRESVKDALSPVNHPAMRGGNGGNIMTFNDLESAEGEPLSRDKFLAKLPAAVIKNGKVIDIRGGIGKMMGAPAATAGGEPSKVALVPTAADALLSTSQRNHMGPVLPPPSREGGFRPGAPSLAAAAPVDGASSSGSINAPPGPEIATLQVKNEDGTQTLIVKLQYNDTIGALRKYIDAHREKQKDGPRGKHYELRTAFPPRTYHDLTETLRDAGLVPNATLFLRAI